MGDKVAQIHVGKQDLSKLQTRKMKGLKEKYDQKVKKKMCMFLMKSTLVKI